MTLINAEIHFAWQVQYLVSWKGDFTGSAHCKWRFICEADQSWDSFCVAGAIVGEVGGWLLLHRALSMTFHMWDGSIMRFISRGRRSILWRWRLPFVASRMVNDISYVSRINPETHFSWQAQYLVKLEDDTCCSPHCKWRFNHECYFVGQSSTGVVLCSTEVVLE